MALVEPIPGERAAVGTIGSQRALILADYHAGYEAALRYERGVTVPSRAASRRDRLLGLLEETEPDRLVVLGDLMRSIGEPGGAERAELEVLFEALPRSLSVTIVKGNHDGAIESWLEGTVPLDILSGSGAALGEIGVCHGHTWPDRAALAASVLCSGHEHPCVRLEDEVGGSRVEPIWYRGTLEPIAFEAWDESLAAHPPPSITVFPAFNDLVGGTWVNVPGQSYLSPFLPEGIAEPEGYLVDGTRLGPIDTL
ncbi:MAG: metallophosphoesterase [Natrialbaceae archaeon]|nr:metallophosphoesterase [Natrialbaceae archaeon]